MLPSDAKLYVVVAADLSPGLQISQSCHAARQFQHEHSELEKQWFEQSNTIAILSVPDSAAVAKLLDAARAAGISASKFEEPDLGMALTAIALEPSREAKRLCKSLPRALAE